MKTDIFPLDHDVEMLKKRRTWYILALVLFVVSLLLQQPLLFLASLFILLIGLVPDLWYRQGLRHLLVRQQVNQRHLFFGEDVVLSVIIENQKLLPLPWLDVENKITPPLALLSKRVLRLQKTEQDTLMSTWLLWSFQRVTRRYHMRCDTRGLHICGPIKLRCSDPFGWLETDVALPAGEVLLVYPLIAPLETLGLSSIHPFGEYASRQRLFEDPLRVVGVRDYLPGDDPRRIHWKATAHSGVLRSKVYEPSSMRRLLLLLDAWNYSDEMKGIDSEQQELTITTAASLAVWALEESYQVGLLVNCAIALSPFEDVTPDSLLQDMQRAEKLMTTEISAPVTRIPFSLDAEQQERLLSTLARLVPRYNTTIERVIDTEERMFPLGTTIVLISSISSLNEETVERLLDLRSGGAAVHLVLTGDEAELKTDIYDLPVHYPGGKEKWRELIATVNNGKGTLSGTSSTSLRLD
ncbi:MAG TPA: DUF58 domain-containing protein [Ktedonobacteraceae bacterium]